MVSRTWGVAFMREGGGGGLALPDYRRVGSSGIALPARRRAALAGRRSICWSATAGRNRPAGPGGQLQRGRDRAAGRARTRAGAGAVRQRQARRGPPGVTVKQHVQVQRARRVALGADATERFSTACSASSSSSGPSEVWSSATALTKSGPWHRSGALRYSEDRATSRASPEGAERGARLDQRRAGVSRLAPSAEGAPGPLRSRRTALGRCSARRIAAAPAGADGVACAAARPRPCRRSAPHRPRPRRRRQHCLPPALRAAQPARARAPGGGCACARELDQGAAPRRCRARSPPTTRPARPAPRRRRRRRRSRSRRESAAARRRARTDRLPLRRRSGAASARSRACRHRACRGPRCRRCARRTPSRRPAAGPGTAPRRSP